MQLKSIKMENFRQFRDASLEFPAAHDGKNVTIVIGENGSGKTTIAQAFSWCFYGESEFKDKNLLNRITEQQMVMPGDSADVVVTINLEFGGVEHRITRRLKYVKQKSGKVRPERQEIMITRSNDSTPVLGPQCDDIIKKILPKALSKYFFFDGEKIETMGREISDEKKVEEFERAIKDMVGLNSINNAINHFNPDRSASVVAAFQNSFVPDQDKRVDELSEEIRNLSEQIDDCEARVNELNEEIEKSDNARIRAEAELANKDDDRKRQADKTRLLAQLDEYERSLKTTQKIICGLFSRNILGMVSMRPCQESLDIINKQDFGTTELPYVREETIRYLLEHKSCLCGRPLEHGTPAYITVQKLYDVVPPKSLGMIVSEFKTEVSSRMRGMDSSWLSDVETQTAEMDRLQEKYDSTLTAIDAIENELRSGNVDEIIRTLQNKIDSCKEIVANCRRDIRSIDQKMGILKSSRDKKIREKQELLVKTGTNRDLELCLEYSTAVYEELQAIYNRQEASVRRRLEKNINGLFKQIYHGKLNIKIGPNYQIMVKDDEYHSDVETSDGQSISVIFAFISAIIKMARENANHDDPEMQHLSSETYPLVMDAPLSTFDKKRIDSVCRTLPSVAEQVIIFIKDTDGDIAKEKLAGYISNSLKFHRVSEFETTITE